MLKLNYQGNLSDQIGVVLGPNLFNELLKVVSQEYNSETNKTTLGLEIYND